MVYAGFKNLRISNLDSLKLDKMAGRDTLLTYTPLLNIYGPYFFYPPHCHPSAGTGRFHSPIIGVFRNHNEIEDDVIASMDSLFRGQQVFFYIW